MAQVTFIIGLPGSGKSFLAKTLEASSINPVMLIDDPTTLDLSKLDNTLDVIVTDPHLCNPRIKANAVDIFKKRGYLINFIFFENNVEKCLKNIEYRNDDRIISRSGLESFRYSIPENVPTIEIWQNEN